MSTGEPSGLGRPHLGHPREQQAEHRLRARAEREEAGPAEVVDTAAFDLSAGLAQPVPGHPAAGYDVDTDLGPDARRPAPSAPRPR